MVNRMGAVSKAKFAEVNNVSRAAVTQACNKGILEVTKGGRINPAHPKNLAWAKNAQTNSEHRKRIGAKKSKKQKQREEADRLERIKKKLEAMNDGDVSKMDDYRLPEQDEIRTAEQIMLPMHVDDVTKETADRIKTIQQIKKLEQELAVKRGELVPRKQVQKIFAKLYQIDVNEFRQLGDKLAPDCAAICGIDDAGKIMKVGARIEKEVFKTLQHIKRVLDDYLVKMGEEDRDEK